MWWRRRNRPKAEHLEGLVVVAAINGMHGLADEAPDRVNPIWSAIEERIEVRLTQIGGSISDSSTTGGHLSVVLGYAPLASRPREFDLVAWTRDLWNALQVVLSTAPCHLSAELGLSQGRFLVGTIDDRLQILGNTVNEALAASYADSKAAIRASATCFPDAIPGEVRLEGEFLVW